MTINPQQKTQADQNAQDMKSKHQDEARKMAGRKDEDKTSSSDRDAKSGEKDWAAKYR